MWFSRKGPKKKRKEKKKQCHMVSERLRTWCCPGTFTVNPHPALLNADAHAQRKLGPKPMAGDISQSKGSDDVALAALISTWRDN